ncbi:MAG: ABC transporter substrate-binding protein [Fusobacteria bacterium]|nr:ABC transporter substrate-binding protein [Fusobacteriota bacterium]
MKKILILFIMLNITIFAEKGGYSDTIYYNVKMSEEIAIKDVAEGRSDIYLTSVSANMYSGLDEETKSKLDVYTVPSGSWDFLLNPYPNQKPYQIVKGDKTYINPFANREIRYAMNFLINRKYIVDEIQGGNGGVAYTPATPKQPNAWKLDMIAEELGFSESGNKEKAIQIINSEMDKMGKLPENSGRLTKKGKFWYFDNEPITIKFVMRVDDPEGRLKLGNYFSDILTELGFTVEKLQWDRIKCINSVYYDNPENFNWSIYTEGWLAGATYIWWSTGVLQHLTPEYGNMPGWGENSWWNYTNDNITVLAKDLLTGNILTIEEYWDKLLSITKLGLEDSVRIFISYQNDYYITNKNRIKERLPYGLGDGLNEWSIQHAKTDNKTLNILQRSASGGLFMSPWDPIGANGFADSFSMNVILPVFDREITQTPFGLPLEKRAKLIKTESKPYRDKDGNLKGEIDVDEDAHNYDVYSHSYKNVGKGVKAVTKSTYEIKFGKWHHNRDITINDYIYADGFVHEWTYKTDENDKTFNSQYSLYFKDSIEKSSVGWKIENDNTVTVWSNSYFPSPIELERAAGSPGLKVMAAAKGGIAVPWEITEAISLLVSEGGSKSKNIYGFTQKEGITPIDLKSEVLTKDIIFKLNEMIKNKHIPIMLKNRVNVDEAIKNYNLAIKWLTEKKHAIIGYGPYYLDEIDSGSGFAKLKAFRNSGYPFEVGEFEKYFKEKLIKIDYVDYENVVSGDEDLVIEINLSESIFPEIKRIPATIGDVNLYIMNSDKKYSGDKIVDGKSRIIINKDALNSVDSESLKFVITAGINEIFVDTYIGEIFLY